MKNPADFGVSQPIPLKYEVERADLLQFAELFSLVHFPFGKNQMEKRVEVAIGDRHKEGQSGSLTSNNVISCCCAVTKQCCWYMLQSVSSSIWSSVQHSHADMDVVKYDLDTYVGSSGAPLLYFGDREVGIVIMAVHLRGCTERPSGRPVYNQGSVLTKTVLDRVREFSVNRK